MRNRTAVVVTMIFSLLLSVPLYADDRPDQAPAGVDGAKGPDGVIGISIHIGAERVGDPASLYIGRVHREGPAHKAGLRHGDELINVDGTAVSGKSYEQVVKMIRGEAGSTVKLQIKREGEESSREISVTRVSGDNLARKPIEHGTYKDKPKDKPKP
ncbi:MAG: PDZ domain-containing protein [Nitrospira sp.]|nr:PDZ domain-containing protein [Nitrospira sp.]